MRREKSVFSLRVVDINTKIQSQLANEYISGDDKVLQTSAKTRTTTGY